MNEPTKSEYDVYGFLNGKLVKKEAKGTNFSNLARLFDGYKLDKMQLYLTITRTDDIDALINFLQTSRACFIHPINYTPIFNDEQFVIDAMNYAMTAAFGGFTGDTKKLLSDMLAERSGVMTQAKANKIFESSLGSQIEDFYATPDGKPFIRYEEAVAHCQQKLGGGNDPNSLGITQWFRED